MKRIIFLVAALLTVFSGIAAVTAYEGHMVDVKAHVENALMVEKSEVEFGITFPQGEVETQFLIGTSESFRSQTRFSTVKYSLYWEPKAVGTHTVVIDDPKNAGYFIPIWPYIDVEVDGTPYPQTAYVVNTNGTILIGSGTMTRTADSCDEIHFLFDPPVFDKWYNALTDPRLPSAVLGPDYYVTELEDAACGFTALVPHTDLGSNFKIQVTGFVVDVP